jgi:hypothetical protein
MKEDYHPGQPGQKLQTLSKKITKAKRAAIWLKW